MVRTVAVVVCLVQRRSEVEVGARSSTSPGPHCVNREQFLSEKALPGLDSYSSFVQIVRGRQRVSLVAVHSWAKYSVSAEQRVQSAHRVSEAS